MACAGGHFLCAVEIYTNQARMASFGIVADRAFLFDQAESIPFQEPDQFAQFHARTVPDARHEMQADRRSAVNTSNSLTSCLPKAA